MSTDAKVTPEGSDQVAAWLVRRGIKFTGPMRAPIESFNDRKSQTNQARPEALITEVVERYTTAWKAGDLFPPVVGYIVAGKMVIIDGNHRLASAKKAGQTHIWAFAVAPDTASELITLLTVEANAKHGAATTTEWRVEQALHLVDIGISQELAVSATGIRELQLKERLAVRRADDRARRMGVSGFSSLAPGIRREVGSFKDDAVFVVAADVALVDGLNVTEMRALAKTVRRQSSETDRLKTLTSYSEERKLERATRVALQRGGRSLTSPKLSLTTAIGKLLNYDISKTGRIFQTPFERNEINRRLEEAAMHLMAIQDEIARLNKEDRGELAS